MAALEAAVKAFAELGFENATLALIAQRAGVTAATLPYHFRDKQGLLEAVVDQFYRELMAFGSAFGVPSTLDEGLARVYAWSEAHRDGIRVILRGVLERGGLEAEVREQRMGQALALGAAVVSERFGVGERAARDAGVALTHLVVRFVTNSPEDNRRALGVATDDEVRARVLDILGKVARTLLGLS